MATSKPIQAGWLYERVRTNVTQLKALRRMSNYTLADAGGFTSRQLVDNRLAVGTTDRAPTPIDCDDLARFAAALRVQPHVLLLPTDEAVRWAMENPNFKPERLAKQSLDAIRSDIMRERRRAYEKQRRGEK